MTRLEEHCHSFQLNDKRGSLLRIEELTSDELALISSSFLERLKQINPQTLDDMYRAYIGTLHEWGVMCPHPVERRDYEASNRWYDCTLCGSSVIG